MGPWLKCSALLTELPIKAVYLISRSMVQLHSAASEPHPLFSAATAAGVVFLLYIPQDLLSLLLSPVLLSTLLLLVVLLHYGSPPPPQAAKSSNSPGDPMHMISALEAEVGLPISDKKSVFHEYCYGNRGGLLEIIYEECEREEAEEANEEYWPSPEYSELGLRGLTGFCYADSDVENDLIEIELEEDNMFEIDISAYR